MIERFSTLFAGHIDLGDMGQNATPANERRYDDAELATIFSKSEALAKCMDRNGFDTLWLAEHHFQHEGYECIPNILMMAVHLAHLTKELKIGCGFNIAPMWHPLRLAEDYAMADHMTGGRVRFGVGRGYHTREVETFDAPMLDKDANRDLFEEQVDIMFKAFHQDRFSHKGKHYTLPPSVPYRGYDLEDLTLVPRPKNLPVECWQPVVSATERGLDFMVKHNMKGIVGGGSALMAEKSIHAFQAAYQRAGYDIQLGEKLCVGIVFYLAESREKAIREATPYFEEHAKMFAPLGFMGPISDAQMQMLGERGGLQNAGLPTLEALCEAGAWYCGTPEGLVDYLQALSGRYPGLQDVNLQSSMGTPQDVMISQLEIVANDVIPAFKRRAALAAE